MRFPGHETVSIGNRVRVNVASELRVLAQTKRHVGSGNEIAWPGVPIFPAHVKRDPWGRGCVIFDRYRANVKSTVSNSKLKTADRSVANTEL